MMNQGFSRLIIFVVSWAYIQDVLNQKFESDNSVPVAGGNLTLSCLTPDLFTDGVVYWFSPNKTEHLKCYPMRGGVCERNTSSYSFTANISGAYAYITGLDRARDGGTWKCMQVKENISREYTIEIVIYTSPGGVNLVQTSPNDVDLGVKSITLMCQTVNCAFPAPTITWYYKTEGQIATFMERPGYTYTSTSQCPQQEAIYSSNLYLPRGTNFSGNIPKTIKFLCEIIHPLLDEEKQYSNVSIDVMFAVQVSNVTLVDSESGKQIWYEGIPQTLKCFTSPARPVPVIQWFPEPNNATNANITNKNITNTNGLVVTESEITIIPKRDQIYTIYCAGNIDGQPAVNSTIVQIYVLYAPDITVTVAGSYHLNMTSILTCEASGFPTNYTFHPWKQMIGEVTIRADLVGIYDDITHPKKTTLTLNMLSLKDLGTYVCSVDNGVRGVNGYIMQTSAAVLNVTGPPVVVNKTNYKVTGQIGSSANIHIAFYSDPFVTGVTFQRNGSNVENTSRTHIYLSTTLVQVLFYNENVNLTVSMAHLLIDNLRDDDFDDYNLVLQNNHGKTDFKVQLIPPGSPLKVATFYYNRFIEDKIEFHFDPGFNGGRKQTFVIEYSSVISHNWTNTSITDLQEDQNDHRHDNGTYCVTVTKPSPGDYVYRIYSKNTIGRSPYSMNVSVHISQDKKDSNANPWVAAVVGSFIAATVVILGITATRIMMNKGIFSTKKSIGAYQSRRPMLSLRDDFGVIYENMPVMNVNVENEYVNALTVRQSGTGVHDDAERVHENRNDVDLTRLGSNGDLIYADLEMAIPKENNGKSIIHGLQNRTEYAEIAFDKLGKPLPYSDDETDSL